MKECATPGCTNTELIHSGIDSFCREIPFTEKYCYPCGNAFFTIKNDIVKFIEEQEGKSVSEVVQELDTTYGKEDF